MTRVVIADDESIIRLDLKELLEDAGYEVVGEAADGAEAIELIRQLQPDLALVDIKMPQVDGLTVAEEVSQTGTKVVILTAFSQRDLIETARDAGVTAYLVKPFRASEILPKLAAIVLGQSTTEILDTVDDKLETRDLVQQAKVFLMDARGMTEPEAFDFIQQTAMRSRSRMRDVAVLILRGDDVG
jgi:response regulator NasT